ncbi:MAG: PKD domain-containing protein [Flavobacteriales bacterium]|nr:PKD domain-containing protein [Flavobacteriales bacterium]
MALSVGETKAQVTAKFTSNIQSGCSPQTVVFTDQSTGPVTSWKWDFGNGNTSTLKSPVASYGTPGKYTVTLIVSDGTNKDTIIKVNYITIFKNPDPYLSIDGGPNGCSPFNAHFNDSVILGDAPITTWIWDYGDGNVDNGTNPNPIHTYNSTGTFPVSLQVVDANGCSKTILLNNYVTVTEGPTATFTADKTIGCSPPLVVKFTNNSTGTGLTYVWNFGDGGTSTATNPNHTYTNTGTYTVKLYVTNNKGCTDSLIRTNYITINDPIADFTFIDTACVNQNVAFTNGSSGATNYLWNFGDGGTTAAVNPNHTYTGTGTYTVTLIAKDPTGTCQDTVTKVIEIIDLAAAFSVDPAYGCQVPHTVDFTDLTIGGVKWSWNFGDGGTSTQQNPSHTYANKGSYTVTLTVTTASGCKDVVTIPAAVVINPMTVNFVADTIEGCAPLKVDFTDLTLSDSTITNWYWDFGDGNTSTQQNPTNIYVNDTDYTVKLVVVNELGCTDSITHVIEVGTKIPPNFTVDEDTVCAQPGAVFTDLTGDPRIDKWEYIDFGDGGSDNQQNPTHMYQDTGWMDVTLVLTYNGCKDTLEIDSMLYVNGPIWHFSAPADCDNPFTYQFTADEKDAQRWYWDFGDGSAIDSVNKNPLHVFPARGTYNVSVTAYNDSTGCMWVEPGVINVTVPDAVITNDTVAGCWPLNQNFNSSGSQDASTYNWSFGNGSSSSAANPTYKYTTPGVYPVRLIVKDIHNCPDTAYGQVHVVRPDADFAVDSIQGCVPLPVNFTDGSYSDSTVVSWLWNFGDGGTSSQQDPTHVFTTNGKKTVTLIVTDKIGCKDTVVRSNYINSKQPIPIFNVTDRQLCSGDSVTFQDATTGTQPFTYYWDFGDGSTSSQPNPGHVFADTGYFHVELTITDADGCDSTITKTDYIHVQGIPISLISSNKTVTDCYPEQIDFRDSSISNYINQWQWDFGDGSISVLQDPVHNYTQPGTYDVSLIVTTTYGCTDTLVIPQYITVTGPFALFHLSPDTICLGEAATFVIDSTLDVDSWSWDFGDGLVLPGTGDTITHIYDQKTGLIYPKMIYQSVSGCVQYAEDTIFIHQVMSGFSVSDTASCLPLITTFTNSSIGHDVWMWDFGDGSTSSQNNPTHTYNQEGDYDVSLIISNSATGCTDTMVQVVHAYLKPIITIDYDSVACEGSNFQMTATGGITYIWTPSDYLSDTSIANPWVLSLPDDITYQVVVIDDHNCIDSTSIDVRVQHKPVVTLPNDTAIIIGELIDNIDAFGGNGFTYQWTPTTWLTCSTCPNPEAKPLKSICYTVLVTDSSSCFMVTDSMCIDVIDEYSLDVPKAFTPNGDGNNDVVYVKGWGIEELLTFKIFNRWGELVFESHDVNDGWDGTYKGKPQNPDTYVFLVTGRYYSGDVKSLKGYITLLR